MYCTTAAIHAQYSGIRCGDVIDIKGVKALVFSVDNSGEHGIAMAVKCLRGENALLCTKGKYLNKMPLTLDENDGQLNTQAVFDFIKRNKLPLHLFPVHNWCSQLGEGWYIPSLNELKKFVNFWLGNEVVLEWDDDTEQVLDNSKPFWKQMNTKLLEAGGIPFLNGVYTSTNTKDGCIYVFNFNKQKYTWKFNQIYRINQSKYFTARAIYKF